MLFAIVFSEHSLCNCDSTLFARQKKFSDAKYLTTTKVLYCIRYFRRLVTATSVRFLLLENSRKLAQKITKVKKIVFPPVHKNTNNGTRCERARCAPGGRSRDALRYCPQISTRSAQSFLTTLEELPISFGKPQASFWLRSPTYNIIIYTTKRYRRVYI